MNGLIFSEEDFPGEVAGAAAVDALDGLLALGGGGGGGGVETTGAGTIGASIFRFRCSSKSPIYEKNHNIQSNISGDKLLFFHNILEKLF